MSDNIEEIRQKRFSERRAELQHRLSQIAAEREEREREIANLQAERRERAREQRSQALVPGIEADDREAVATLEAEDDEIEEKIERLKNEAAEIRTKLDRLNEEERTFLLKELPGAVHDEETAIEGLIEAFEEVGTAVLDQLDTVADARRELEEKRRVRNALLAAYRTEDRGERQLQRRNLEAYLRGARQRSSPRAILGFLVLEVVDFTRRGSSPLEAFWQEHGVEPRGGSVLYDDPIPAVEDTIWRLKRGEIPI